jgi:hypothetical protein
MFSATYGIAPRIRRQYSAESLDTFLILIRGILWQRSVKVFGYLFGCQTPLVSILQQDAMVFARVFEPKEDGARGEFPDLATQARGQANLNQTVKRRVT